MKVTQNGNTFKIYDDSLIVLDKLEPQIYSVRFSKFEGFFLEKHHDIEIKEEKIYGVHMDKVEKVLKSFELVERNLGIILSGNKGIGKSLFAKILANKSVEKGLPVIIVDAFIPGIASYIEEIEQECVILFDEFDKTFGNIRTGDNEADPQAGLLSLFDGLGQGKKMFIVTCNELRCLNDYLVNRPGRFHYHIRFEYPSPIEVREYLTDKLEEQYYDEIDKVISFSRKIDLNYDCLRAIAFEINLGQHFEDAIKDLNIVNVNSERYDLELHFTNGEVMTARNEYIDLFSNENYKIWFYNSHGEDIISAEFSTKDSVLDKVTYINYIQGDRLKLSYDEDYKAEHVEAAKALVLDYLSITKCRGKNLHYAL